MSRVNVGVIGLGEVAQIVHLPILQSLSDRFAITAVCDLSPGLLEAVGERYGVAHRYADAADLVAQPNVDAVLVLSSDEYHRDHTVAALEAGKHVLVEKPMCLTMREADEIIAARDRSNARVMVGYMRRFAPAFIEAVAEVKGLDEIQYARVRDIIGQNRLIIEQTSAVLRPGDLTMQARHDRAARASALVTEAIGDAPPELHGVYRLLAGLSSHDLSAMREMLGMPRRVAAARWNGRRFIAAIFEYDDFLVTFETGVDGQRRFDAHIEVYGEAKSVRVQYDTPYIRHLPTTLIVQETVGDACIERVTRPTFKDPYTFELEHFHDVVMGTASPRTTPEDFTEDLRLFRGIISALQVTAGVPIGD